MQKINREALATVQLAGGCKSSKAASRSTSTVVIYVNRA